MATKTERIAQLFKSLTYDEMMAIAEWFSGWTASDDGGNNVDPPTINRDQMAANLSDWAENFVTVDNA